MLSSIDLQNQLSGIFTDVIASMLGRVVSITKIADAYHAYASKAVNKSNVPLIPATADLITLKSMLAASIIKDPLSSYDPALEWSFAFTRYWMGTPAKFGGDSVALVGGTTTLQAQLQQMWDSTLSLPVSLAAAASGLAGALDAFTRTVSTGQGPIS
jgi:hypothetical protein